MTNTTNRIILIGNGFDIAHGLKTKYSDFIDWYFQMCLSKYINDGQYEDELILIHKKYSHINLEINREYKKATDIVYLLNDHQYTEFKIKSTFFNLVYNHIESKKWVDIECKYFEYLKNIFLSNISSNKEKQILNLNIEFNRIIKLLTDYILEVNKYIYGIPKLASDFENSNFNKLFHNPEGLTKVINFNYTETLNYKKYANEEDTIYIHGRANTQDINPIIFGYGDESDPLYQKIEDSGNNNYLEHIKSFGYFKNDNFSKMISFIDSNEYDAYIVGHSCGLSDRILLNEVFENSHCKKIHIYYYIDQNGIDNYTEITKEISRHFKPNSKQTMRRKIVFKNSRNIIPQNKLPMANR